MLTRVIWLFLSCSLFSMTLFASQPPKLALPNLTSDEMASLDKQTSPKIRSLRSIPAPEPVNINEFVKDKAAAIRLGKALFWDTQVGSDGATACGTCHFHAFGDDRIKNTVHADVSGHFTLPGANGVIDASHFPITSFTVADKPGEDAKPEIPNPFVHNSGDRVASQGVRNFDFIKIIEGKPYEKAQLVADSIFNVNGENVRRVEPRNTPTVINAVFNYSNFWDGRARNIFNGVNPFGELDEAAKVFVKENGKLQAVQVRIPDASLASQAVGPPLSDFEMSSRNRTFPEIAKKVLEQRVLKYQRVHPEDSVLGGIAGKKKGLNTDYEKMIKEAFLDKWWKDSDHKITFATNPKRIHHPDANDPRTFALDAGEPTITKRTKQNSPLSDEEYSQMEANFSLFFGLAVQMYEATLVSDDSKWDRVQEGVAQFTEEEQLGSNAFAAAGCGFCHLAPEFTSHSVRNVRNGLPADPLVNFIPAKAYGRRATGQRSVAFVDTGILNLGVRPAGSDVPGFPGYLENNEDVGHGALSPIMNPNTGKPYPLSNFRLAELKKQNLLPADVAKYIPDLPADVPEVPQGWAEEVDGTQKTPSLRNAELLGPYFHNGDAATLAQVVDFYTRGGNFPVTDIFNRDSRIAPIAALADPLTRKNLVKFLMTLTDDRVRLEKAPFDHPELMVPNGSPGNSVVLRCQDRPKPGINSSYCDDFIKVPAIGAHGRGVVGLPPLGTFLDLDPTAS